MTRGRNRHTMLNKAVKWTEFFCPSYRILDLLSLLVKPQKDLVPTMKSACRIFAIQNSIACAICANLPNLPSRMGYFCEKKEEIWNSGLNDANGMVKQPKRSKTLCPSTIAEGAVTLHTETCKWTLSPCRQGRVVYLQQRF